MRRLGAALCIGGVAIVAAAGCASTGGATGGVAPEADAAIDAPSDAGDASLGTLDDASSILDSGCATATAQVERDPIYMLVVLDGSGSMAEDGKWAAVVPALEAFIDDLESLKDVSFGVGLTVFSDSNDATGGVGPYTKVDVPIAFVDAAQAQKLHARLDGAEPKAQTPTLAVLEGQYPLVEQFTPGAPLLPGGKKVLVLMTDGVPYPDTGTQQPACIQAATDELAKAAPAGPVTTFAVGIGYTFPYDPTIYDPKFMAQLALAGGAPNQPCDPNETKWASNMCHFQITPVGGAGNVSQLEQDFLIAFDKIRAKVTSCELALDKSGIVDPSLVNVVFTDARNTSQVVPEDPTDGWTYDDPTNPTKVVLHGKSCNDLKANPSGSVEVVLGCKTIVK
jgi:hypothetical protein